LAAQAVLEVAIRLTRQSRWRARHCKDYGWCWQMLDLSSLDLGEVAAALADQTDCEHRWLISPETGEVVFWTSDTGIDSQTPVDLDELDLIDVDRVGGPVQWMRGMMKTSALCPSLASLRSQV
jgi:hypothetical protein